MPVVDLTYPDIFEEAFEMAGVDFRDGYDVRIARRSLSLLTQEWANRGLNLWTIESGTQALTAGTATYTLPTDTIDLIDHVIRSTDGNTDYPIRRIAVGEYSQLSKKNQSSRPTTIYVERLVTPQVTLWPNPDKAYTLVYWRLARMESISSGITGSPDMPGRFHPALVAGLAVRIARIKRQFDMIPMLEAEYEKQFGLAYNEDRDRASYYIKPRIARV